MTPTTFPDDLTLAEARAELRRRVEDGERCPCCSQYAKVYPRAIHASMAAGLIKLYRRDPRGIYHEIAGFMTHRELADFAKLAHWGLVAEQPSIRDDGSTRTGWWKITTDGIDFVEGRITVPKHARVYDGRCLGLTGKKTTIQQCLGRKFNYAELMGHEFGLKVEETRLTVSPEPVAPDESGWTAPALPDVGGTHPGSSGHHPRLAIFDEDAA